MRNHAVDFFRGIAILIMVSANSYSYFFSDISCPIGIRVLFSSAAPIFIFMSGVSLRLSEENGKSIYKTIKRIFQIVFFAVLIDVLIWEILPFYTMDVLYLISFSLIILLILRKLPDYFALIVFALINLLTLLFSPYYIFDLVELSIFSVYEDYNFLTSVSQTFIGGWFPVFPWIGISLLGYYTAKHRFVLSKFSRSFLVTGLIGFLGFLYLTIEGIFSFNLPRSNYMEIFYPVTFPFFAYMISIFLILFYFIVKNSLKFKLLKLCGTYSLAVYFFHVVLIKFYLPIFDLENQEVSLGERLVIFSSLFLLIFSHVLFLIWFERKTGKSYPFLKFLLGV